ncbi:ankyrin repeat-containing domain protein [Aspergillus bertholletiae]|uniref:Ankyrin repeat-containing domain protein n=1 Tax=Aspergillus bertholletiae TaxID=1226010 RepID=A0A5N7BA06_9EURO|nr:ankyrin repeat-containing domain protein [Aspergillus bertholletiae]
MFAAVCGHKEMAELLVSHGADMGRWTGHSTPLLEAIDHGHTEVAEYFLMNSADFDINRQFYIYCPIEHAAHDGYVDIVKLLLRYGVDPNGFPALIAATARGHVEVSRVLLEAGASIEKIYPEGGKNQDAFFSAAGFNRPAAVALLIEYGASLERRDVRGRTPLIFAAQCQSLEAVEVLLRHGAKANALVHGCTALSFAIDEGSVPMTKLLLENGADVAITHDQPSDNVSFLLRVMNRRHDPEVIAAMMKLLLNHGADPNDCDRKGRTPLFFATMRHDLEMMRLLLAHGANPNRDDEKIDLLSWAFLKGHEDINLKMTEESISAQGPTPWTAVLPLAQTASALQPPATQTSQDDYYYHVYKFGEPDQAWLECLSQEPPSSDDDEMLLECADFADEEPPPPDGDEEYFPSGHELESPYGDAPSNDNATDDSMLLDTSSYFSVSAEGEEEQKVSGDCHDGMEKLDETVIEEIETKTLLALSMEAFMKIAPIRSMMGSLTQQELADIVWKVFELDKFQATEHKWTAYNIEHSHPSSELKNVIQCHLTDRISWPGKETTRILTSDCTDIGPRLHKKDKSALVELLQTLSNVHTAKLYAILERQIQALPDETRQQIYTEAHHLLNGLDTRELWG